jgi:hypothetical protein
MNGCLYSGVACERLAARLRGAHALLRLSHLRRGDHLHRLGDLLGVLDTLDLAANFLAGCHGFSLLSRS